MNSGKSTTKVCDTISTGAQTGFDFQLGPDVGGSAEVEITATGSVVVQGRMDSSLPWVDLTSAAATPGGNFLNINRVMPQMRANISANSGTIRVWILA